MAEDLGAKVTKLQSTLQRINAPNMKALEKYVRDIPDVYNCQSR